MPFEYTRRELTTASELRAIAHPLRTALLELLAVEGPLTATDCAALTGESPANCSWHLRQLAKYRFVEEAGGGVGRQRPWRAVTTGLSFDDAGSETEVSPEVSPEVSRDVSTAGRALTEVWLDHEVRRYRAYLDRHASETAEWRSAAGASQSLAWLTVDELRAVNDAITALLIAHADRVDRQQRPPGARLVRLVALTFPDRAPDHPGPDESGPDESGPDQSGPDQSGPDQSGPEPDSSPAEDGK